MWLWDCHRARNQSSLLTISNNHFIILETRVLSPIISHPSQTFLLNESCIGIMGGRKRHSLYFTGFQGNKLIHYDPHTCPDRPQDGKRVLYRGLFVESNIYYNSKRNKYEIELHDITSICRMQSFKTNEISSLFP